MEEQVVVDAIKQEDQTCHICNQTFDKDSLESHYLSHKKEVKTDTVKCNLCEKSFVTKDSLYCHLKKIHQENESFDCDGSVTFHPKRQFTPQHFSPRHFSP